MPPPVLVGWLYTAGAITHENRSLTRMWTSTPPSDAGSQYTSTSLNKPLDTSRCLICVAISGVHSSPRSICAMYSTVSVVVLVLSLT